ncbi:TetR/AcrR family transcriptional regulator [Ruegeria atlantica]|uniref:Bacterial regulatory proteins, tetR family n=1 Tax=Ruegeria atlantica TaxID=81569 RepID=A0A0P1EDW1_9RHOB|nr:TetR/AcrR family transcriptional regulator [Ruegeria atlantica]CUH47608.1 Bacterial regulatory proteins, tetR family [Ruegeria atlantica]
MTQIKGGKTVGKKRFSKQDWLDSALDLLRTGGIEAVRVERIADKLGVAKSGFYYHFRDRADLHKALLDHWVQLDGVPFLEERRFSEATPVEKLAMVADVVDSADLSRYDNAIRQWARQDPKVRRVWRKEMNKRLEHIRGLFRNVGFEGDQLEMRVRTFVAYQVSERELFSELSAKDRSRIRKLRLELLVKG